MLEVKLFEVRDEGTLIPCAGIRMVAGNSREHAILRRAGYGQPECIFFGPINSDGRKWHYDPYGWDTGARTLPTAHEYVRKNWNSLISGDVVCVEWILGERETPKETEL